MKNLSASITRHPKPSSSLAILTACITAGCALTAEGTLIITGIIDGPRTGGLPKAIEVYVLADIADLSLYQVAQYNNGAATPGTAFALSGSATAGQFLYIASESTGFSAYFGFAPSFTTGVLNVNGDDGVVLLSGTDTVDIFGIPGLDPTEDTSFNYLDTWFYRVNGTPARPDPAGWTSTDWFFPTGQSDALDPVGTSGTNTTAADLGVAMPIGTYAVPEPTTALTLISGLGLLGLLRRRSTRA